ncbi:hypothetical protein GCM10023261_07340 [Bartonella jaculi]|uniref:Uncharacterized protein n=1 Tax=Bartonella jaculi TaxID=686226 RepID=A0ABP9N1S4_9HYPH
MPLFLRHELFQMNAMPQDYQVLLKIFHTKQSFITLYFMYPPHQKGKGLTQHLNISYQQYSH